MFLRFQSIQCSLQGATPWIYCKTLVSHRKNVSWYLDYIEVFSGFVRFSLWVTRETFCNKVCGKISVREMFAIRTAATVSMATIVLIFTGGLRIKSRRNGQKHSEDNDVDYRQMEEVIAPSDFSEISILTCTEQNWIVQLQTMIQTDYVIYRGHDKNNTVDDSEEGWVRTLRR